MPEWLLAIALVCADTQPCKPIEPKHHTFLSRELCLEAGRKAVLFAIADANGNPPKPAEIICRGPNGEVARERGPWSAM